MTLISDRPIENDFKIPPAPLALGLAGLIPFFAGALLAIHHGANIMTPSRADMFLISYGAIILSFMAGVRWGTSLFEHDKTQQTFQVSLSIVPALLAWLALFLPFAVALPLLALSHAALAVWDIRAMYDGHGPFWYGKLRMVLASIAVTILVVVGVIRYFDLFSSTLV